MKYFLLLNNDAAVRRFVARPVAGGGRCAPRGGDPALERALRLGRRAGHRARRPRARRSAQGARRPRPRRRDDGHRRPVRRDEGAGRRLLRRRVQGPRPGDRARAAHPDRLDGLGRDPPDRRVSVESLFREEWGRAVSILIRVLGDFELAEDAVQEAFVTAVERWPRDGTPRNPSAWIVATARNRAIDRIRRERTLARKTELLARLEELRTEEDDDVSSIPDERLSLVFTCCHPALAPEARVALTLREVGGLPDARDRARVPRPRVDARAAARAREAEDPRRGHPVPRAARPSAAPSGCTRCSPSSTSSSTRATPRPPTRSSSGATSATTRSASGSSSPC